jgi:hypothetical protein
MRYFVGLFSLAWLGTWFAGFNSLVSNVQSGEADVFGLVIWALSAAFALYYTYRAFRPSVPESLRLMPDSVTYDSGIPPLVFLQKMHGNRCFQRGRARSLIGASFSRCA